MFLMQNNNVSHVEDIAPGSAADRRAIRRHRTLKGGSISFNNGNASYQCTVKNVSETGALLRLGDTTGVPSEFDFAVTGEAKKSHARLVWRKANTIGIQLTDDVVST